MADLAFVSLGLVLFLIVVVIVVLVLMAAGVLLALLGLV